MLCILYFVTDSFDQSTKKSNIYYLVLDSTADELCVRHEEIPVRYLCSEDEKATSKRWLVDVEDGECIQLDLCSDDEINISGLFHSATECMERCLN